MCTESRYCVIGISSRIGPAPCRPLTLSTNDDRPDRHSGGKFFLLFRHPGAVSSARREKRWAQPVVHFEIMGKDGEALSSFYSDLFGWRIDADNPMKYGIVPREDNLNPEGIGIGGGVGQAPAGYQGHVTVYVEVPDVEAALARAKSLGGSPDDGSGNGDGGPRDRPLHRPRGSPDRRGEGGLLTGPRQTGGYVGPWARPSKGGPGLRLPPDRPEGERGDPWVVGTRCTRPTTGWSLVVPFP